VISFLAVVLIGKGVHAIQEAGAISISIIPVNFSVDAIGLYPTWESVLAQLFVIALIVVLWNIGNKSTKAVPKQASAS
jgi:high-affinity iron transporter